MKSETKSFWIITISIVIIGLIFSVILFRAFERDLLQKDKKADEICKKLDMEVLNINSWEEVTCYDKITKETRRLPI